MCKKLIKTSYPNRLGKKFQKTIGRFFGLTLYIGKIPTMWWIQQCPVPCEGTDSKNLLPICMFVTMKRLTNQTTWRRSDHSFDDEWEVSTVLSKPRRTECWWVSSEVRVDNIDDYMSQFPTQRRCGQCHKNTGKGCLECGLGLHDHCFELWHGIVWTDCRVLVAEWHCIMWNCHHCHRIDSVLFVVNGHVCAYCTLIRCTKFFDCLYSATLPTWNAA